MSKHGCTLIQMTDSQPGAFHPSDPDQECSKTTSAAEMTILHCFNPKNGAEDVQEGPQST